MIESHCHLHKRLGVLNSFTRSAYRETMAVFATLAAAFAGLSLVAVAAVNLRVAPEPPAPDDDD